VRAALNHARACSKNAPEIHKLENCLEFKNAGLGGS
jgi:hypothetical protein